jgi:hypothetical protein
MSDESTQTNLVTAQIISEGQALVRALEAIEIIVPSGLFERQLAKLLTGVYRHRLESLIATAPAWISEQILSASTQPEDGRGGYP